MSTPSPLAMLVAALLPCALSTAGCDTAPATAAIERPPPQRLLNPCHRPEDRPDEGDDRALAAWEAETWHRGHACADRLDAWIAWWRERAALTPSKPDHP